MSKSNQLVVFTLAEQFYALHLSAVQRTIRVLEVTPLPEAPEILLGIVNFQGEIIPVLNIRKRFRLSEQETNLSDQLIIARTSKRHVALIVDAVSGVIERSDQEVVAAERIFPDMKYIEGVVKLEDGLILILDLDKFLSIDEEKAISDQLSGLRAQGSRGKND
jgi:purine-binding chemotaxis protein CheW